MSAIPSDDTGQSADLSAVLNHLEDEIWITNERGDITYVNDCALTNLGLSDRRCVDQPLDRPAASLAIFNIDGSPRSADDLPPYRVLKGEPRVDVQEIIRRRDSAELRRWVRSTPIHSGSGKLVGTVSVVRPVLRGSDRSGDFAAVVAHELRSPLSVIASAAQLFKMTTGLEAEPVRRISGQIRLMRRMIDDMLDSCRMNRGSLRLALRPDNLAAIVLDAVDQARERIDSRGQRLLVDAGQDPITVNAGGLRIVQQLGNVLDNASKFTPHGGTIAVRVESGVKQAVIRISDTGIGIAPDFLPTMFELFSQAAPSRSGGLVIGLAIARMIIQLHGGEISAHSKGSGSGTEVVIRLPLAATHSADREVHSQVSRHPRRVVLAEDNRTLADIMAELLSHFGCEVAVASDGQEAVRLITDLVPDVALVDIGLPRLNGHEVARQVRQDRRAAGVLMVALSGCDCRESGQGEFDLYAIKPVDVRELVARIESELKARRKTAG